MSILNNRHVVIALLVAPILALIAYFAVDKVVGEKPHAALAGADYRLIARSNCRYRSGRCDLVNGDFELSLRVVDEPKSGLSLELASAYPLTSALIGIAARQGGASEPIALTASSDASRWRLTLQSLPDSAGWLQLAARAGGSLYYAEVPVTFLLPDVGE